MPASQMLQISHLLIDHSFIMSSCPLPSRLTKYNPEKTRQLKDYVSEKVKTMPEEESGVVKPPYIRYNMYDHYHWEYTNINVRRAGNKIATNWGSIAIFQVKFYIVWSQKC